ncbi:Inner membrane component of tripartite multidrug resistance system [Caballeronia glathei]|uniref:Fusaric acid resistance protein n=1 Tax=Caballeronia glathei TaxID=60547 RepID=A0A069PS36_9BURK|nr:FUSC family protein [Caballeronia glathei]KDR43242.1 fusaric acid resistance protein [Caballeronia glathei]CDY79336.1 Inner membrane component of tripartite multidrug resistance system [Caballeronia glathei]
MIYPTAREWLFSVKTFAAAMLALYIGLKLELPRPYWAMATVYIVSNPFVGATRSKALYRAAGTMLGAAAAVLFVPPFVESPYIFAAVVALWTSTLLFLAINDRSARSYAFMLAGYTMPLIALPAVLNPAGVFDLALTRTEEILLGIVCASVVGSAVFPSRLAPTIVARTDAWFRDAALYAKETLAGRIGGATLAACRQRLATTINGLELLLSQLAYDHTRPDIVARARELRGRMQLLLPLMSALGDPLVALASTGRPLPAPFEALLADIVAWFNAPLPTDDTPEPVADDLRQRIADMQPGPDELAAWDGVLLSSALWRLKQVVDVWQDCRTLRVIITQEKGSWTPRYRHWRLGGTEQYFDRGMLLFSAASAGGAIFVSMCIWIASGWNDGAGAVTLAAVAVCFFAALDEPAPQVFTFFVYTCLSVVLAGLYLFVILPTVHDFPMLVLFFAVPFIVIGSLIPRPQYSLATMLTAVNTATFLSIQGTYDANFLTFVNGNLAGPAGLLFAFVWTRVTRPFGAEFAAARLIRSSWHDVVLSASTRPVADQRNLTARMLDRLLQILPRVAATGDTRHTPVESFRDLRVAFNALDLRRLRRRLGADEFAALERVLDEVRVYFQRCLARSDRQPVPASLETAIDTALERVVKWGEAAAAEGAQPASMSRRLRRDALHALVGMRLSLFPGAAHPPGREPAS